MGIGGKDRAATSIHSTGGRVQEGMLPQQQMNMEDNRPWLISPQSPTQDWKIVGGSSGLLVAKALRWAGWRGCQKGSSPHHTSFCSKLQPVDLPSQQTPAEQLKTSWPPGTSVDLLASSSQPGLDSCHLHFLPYRGWGGQHTVWGLQPLGPWENLVWGKLKGKYLLRYCHPASSQHSLSSAHSALPGLSPRLLH